MTLDEVFGDGAHARLEELVGGEVAPGGEGHVTITLADGYLGILYGPPGRFVFSAYTGVNQLSWLAGVFGKWGLEFNVPMMQLAFADTNSANAFQRIGFVPAGGSDMRVTPQRLYEYAEWKAGNAAEPHWHETLNIL